MADLIANKGPVLEPSCGNGVFLDYLTDYVAIELDPGHAPQGAHVMDFFELDRSEKYATIIGNPPYVRHQDILPTTKLLMDSTIFDKRSNLYLYFIEKCIDHLLPNGELIFIVPREFIKSTSSIKLNELIYNLGTITHMVDFGDSKLFTNASPNCVVFRFEKDNFTRKTKYAALSITKPEDYSQLETLQYQDRDFTYQMGQLLFMSNGYSLPFSDIASVKVGAVSGADHIYASDEFGNRQFVYSGTVKDGSLRSMYWPLDKEDAEKVLAPYKEELINRRIKKFTEADWWSWGRGYPQNDFKRIYVNGKTRNPKPFFVSDCTHFDGSVLAIFPKNQDIDLQAFCDALNAIDWQELGFLCDGRYLFSQRSLENCLLPKELKKFFAQSSDNS
jgi:adenine-specific DNA-methyltransferase